MEHMRRLIGGRKLKGTGVGTWSGGRPRQQWAVWGAGGEYPIIPLQPEEPGGVQERGEGEPENTKATRQSWPDGELDSDDCSSERIRNLRTSPLERCKLFQIYYIGIFILLIYT